MDTKNSKSTRAQEHERIFGTIIDTLVTEIELAYTEFKSRHKSTRAQEVFPYTKGGERLSYQWRYKGSNYNKSTRAQEHKRILVLTLHYS